MESNQWVYPLVVLGVVVGLLLVLYGEAADVGIEIVIGGGVIVLAAMAVLTYVLLQIEDGEPAEH